MGITVFKDGERRYFRVTKAWNGKEHQVYVRIGRSEKKALKEAHKVEADLELRRKAYIERKKLSGEGLIHEDGRIVGLQLQTRHREGRKPCTEFKIRVKEPDKKAIFKSVSVNSHGLEVAFDKAVEKICDIRDIALGSDVHKRLLASKAIYLDEGEKLLTDADSEVVSTTETEQKKDKSAGFLDQLKDSLQDFLKTKGASKPASTRKR
ncbi:MAG: hypothetical protein MI864_24390 [Pseudomonadales bacterium]|nr:hypothetical protein [Pseudomonadales bacterium]